MTEIENIDNAEHDYLTGKNKRDTEDYINELQGKLWECINELCSHCGRYKNDYLGACDGCKWYKEKR